MNFKQDNRDFPSDSILPNCRSGIASTEKITEAEKVKCQIDGENFVNFCGLFRKHEL